MKGLQFGSEVREGPQSFSETLTVPELFNCTLDTSGRLLDPCVVFRNAPSSTLRRTMAHCWLLAHCSVVKEPKAPHLIFECQTGLRFYRGPDTDDNSTRRETATRS